ncbi:MAG: hypothetical protein B6I37_04115 [Desulfobacteraceae bacterium 4572_35.2]|nr:MAG: hypothetical protein B6I37_04115 [Desulfobacteraceae bacterium 4572_35.2]
MSRQKNEFINVINWAHKLLAEVINPGDFVIDLTAGRGHDTLWLAQQVDAIHRGQVVAFDVQQTRQGNWLQLQESPSIPVATAD